MNLIAVNARSLLFVPADRLDRLDKALASGAHMVIVDLEDAVAPAAKASARAALQTRWKALDQASRARTAIRINAADTHWHGDDSGLVRSLSKDGLGAVMLAKTESVSQIRNVGLASGTTALLPLIESAEGYAALDLIARTHGVARLVFGHLDFQLDLGMKSSPDEHELDPVRLAFVIASRRAGLPGPVDGVTVNLQDTDQLVQDTQRAQRFGFSGKLCIHPSQLQTVNTSLGPTLDEIDWARRVLAAAEGQSSGAFQFEGGMVDAPVLARANKILNQIP